ncbi:MAG: TetR/AcrR family transcriptional regulator [Chlorobiaceae bacterium]|nr:TetR/AcrR family transcriptional regulator [Chlorobiaceae bacterium]
MGFIRARSDEQREVRYAEIIAAATRLSARMGYEEITLAAIAREANFTRSNLYKYYESKDEIFLEILAMDIAAWRADLQCRLLGTACSVGEFAMHFAQSYRTHKRLLDTLTILFVFIEKNASLEHLTGFKAGLKTEMANLAALTCTALPAMSIQQAEEFLIMQLATANGLHPMTTLTAKQQQAVATAGLGNLHGSFEPRFRSIIEAYLRGVLASPATPDGIGQ